MQTLMLTVEYDGTRYAGWKAAPKKKILIRSWGESILLLPGCSKRTYSYSVPQNRPWCSCKRADSQLSDHFFPVAFCSKEQSESGAASGYRRFRCQTGFRTFSCRITPQTLYLGALYQNRFDS